VDLRISTLPASQGEKVVIRMLDQRTTILSLDSLGLLPDELNRIMELLQAREGIVLVTGPTGSGKTTTLYSMLRTVRARASTSSPSRTRSSTGCLGIVQVQVNEKAGLTFAAALRSILRQDPDVVLVGEIRDKETANIAMQASLTGHLVLSTLHTNDAASSVTRLVDIGIESVQDRRGAEGRRCAAPHAPPLPGRAAGAPAPLHRDVRLFRAVGCCAQTAIVAGSRSSRSSG
jgi:type II secretory ATPase GspE/PulE/Tfp pilus assembly ATPase PilB-like protein